MEFQAVLFDFDYTLGDATRAVAAGFTHALTEMGLPVPDEQAIRATVGMMLEDAFTLVSGDSRPERQAEFRRLFGQVAHPMQLEGVPLFPGARELLLALHGAGIPAAVVSSKRTDTLRAIFDKHGLTGALSHIVGGDLAPRPKPDPSGVLLVLDELHIPPAEALFCGDTVIDAETARRAGTHFCAVLNGVTGPAAFAPFPVDHIAPDLPDLTAWLGLAAQT
ncbi:MAG: HAD family hydrolase [Oscillospiraceae bacterium]|nr:HAD family hydrolase [Oscillospiraceae bacterium]